MFKLKKEDLSEHVKDIITVGDLYALAAGEAIWLKASLKTASMEINPKIKQEYPEESITDELGFFENNNLIYKSMKYLIPFKLFEKSDEIAIREKPKNDYMIGDIVLIKYHLTGDITPVRINKIYGQKISVSHQDVAKAGFDTNYRCAPDEVISRWEIIDRFYGIDEPAEPTVKTINPRFNIPDNTGARGNQHTSNDLDLS